MRAGATVAAVWVAAVLGGCATGGDEPQRPPARGGAVGATGGQVMVDAQVAMARCMRRHGIDMPDPGSSRDFEFDPGERGIDERRLRAAEARCARHRRAIADAAPKRSASELQQDRDTVLRFARCMRRHGAEVPDPKPRAEGAGTAVEVPAGAKDNPRFQRAARACERLDPGR